MKHLIFTFLIVLMGLSASAQRSTFGYDAAGNRINRSLGFKYFYRTADSQTNWDSYCDCIIATPPQLSDPFSLVYIDILSIDGQLVWDLTDRLNQSTSTPRGTITIKNLTNPLKFQTYSINGNANSTGASYYYMTATLLELGSVPIVDGDIVYLSYSIN